MDRYRILIMFMIVTEHALLFTGCLHDIKDLSLINNIAWLLEAFCIGGVNGFFLMSGYFQIRPDEKYGKLKKLWAEVLFYSISIYLVCVWFGVETFGFKDGLFLMAPVFTKRYWFVTTYIALYLLAPYLNRLTACLEKKEYQRLLCVLIIFFCIHPTFIPVRFTLDESQGYGIIWSVVLYLLGSYIKKYKEERDRRKLSLAIYLLGGGVMFLSEYLIVKFHIASGIESRGNFYAYNSVTVFISSLALFLFFIEKKQKKPLTSRLEKGIKTIARSTFAVYLIHAHPSLMTKIWEGLRVSEESNLASFFLKIIGGAIIVFTSCILIDWCRLSLKTQCDKAIFKLQSKTGRDK